jgi:hypothetical protein
MGFKFNTDAVKKQVEDAEHRGGGGDSPFFRWKDVKEVNFRLLPWYQDGDLQGSPFFSYTMHYDINGKQFPCNNKNGLKGGELKSCPVCESRVKMFKSGDEHLRDIAYKLQSRDRAAFQVIVRGEEEKGVQVMSIAQSYCPEIVELLQDDEDIASFGKEGSYLTCKVVKTKKDYPTKVFSVRKDNRGVALEMSGEMEEFVTSTKKKGKTTLDDAVLGYIREFGQDLRALTLGERWQLEPSEIRALLVGLPHGSTIAQVLDTPFDQPLQLVGGSSEPDAELDALGDDDDDAELAGVLEDDDDEEEWE